MVVRSWNLFHGNAYPPRREDHLEEMVRLVTAGGPGLVLLQEVAVWALERPDGRRLVVANVHGTSLPSDPRVPELELRRAAAWVGALAAAGEVVILGGDFNVRPPGSTLAGLSPPGPGLKHVLVRGAAAGPLRTWPDERRRHEGVLLSDRAPVELEVGEPSCSSGEE